MSEKRFIRLDMVGHWRGTEHCSSFGGVAEYWEGELDLWEKGISCYELDNIPFALDSLRHYWENTASMHGDYEKPVKMQVTVFAGKRVPNAAGFDNETLALCEETIMEFPAQEFMADIIAAYDRYEYGDDDASPHRDEKVYHEELKVIAKKHGLI